MWLLNLHFGVSVLCMLTFCGLKVVMKSVLVENGYTNGGKKKSIIGLLWAFFIPIVNLLLVVIMFLMLSIPKDEFNTLLNESKKKRGE